MPTPLCTSYTRRSLSPCPNLNLIHYNIAAKIVISYHMRPFNQKAACT
ncbi:cation-transporting ATPase [Kingella kingae]|nr:cation-transporting ATPase [Kingella kingae]MDK4535781.1 cation-transporting ATPase [Kingella kingae]MDK4564862.1 cation-transporting ATPase [Kingella kingae]MDK4591024.1 cation-transporting ATPase [Kingella kingae]